MWSRARSGEEATLSLAAGVLGFCILVILKLIFGLLLHHYGVRMLQSEIEEKQRKLEKEEVGRKKADDDVQVISRKIADDDALQTPNFKVSM